MVLQLSIFGPKTKQQMETYTRSEQSQQIPQGRKIQNGDTRDDPDLPTDRGVGSVHRFQGRLLPYTHTKPIKKISEISGQTDGLAEGYKNPPLPRRLVGPGQIPTNLSPAYTNTSSSLSGPGLASKHEKNQNLAPCKFLTS